MGTKNLLGEYFTRLIHQTLVQVTGVLGFILTAVLEIAFPGVIIKWVFYLTLLATGVIVGGYQVFAELVKEHEKETTEFAHALSELESKFRELESRQPRILVGFQNETGHLVQRLQLQLNPLPPKPSVDEEVKQKRDKLLARKQNIKPIHRPSDASIFEIIRKPNPKYEEEVEEYLEQYRKYLLKLHEHTIIGDRARYITLVVENQGLYPANNVTIELEMPTAYRKPSGKQELEIWYSMEDEHDLHPPEEPKLFNDFMDIGRSHLPSFALGVPAQDLNTTKPSNTSGPEFIERDGLQLIVYHIKKLIQNRPENDFASFLLWLEDIEQSISWEIPVKIYAEELHRPLEQTLWLDIEIPDTSMCSQNT